MNIATIMISDINPSLLMTFMFTVHVMNWYFTLLMTILTFRFINSNEKDTSISIEVDKLPDRDR